MVARPPIVPDPSPCKRAGPAPHASIGHRTRLADATSAVLDRIKRFPPGGRILIIIGLALTCWAVIGFGIAWVVRGFGT